MKNMMVNVLIGLIVGVIATLLIIYTSAQSFMMKEVESKYSFEQSIEIFEESVNTQGWKIPAVHDMQKTMEKFGKDVQQAKVFELCHPEHAYEILSRDSERIVLSMMPCRIAIYEKSDGKTYVSWMNSKLIGGMMKGVVPKVMKAASQESDLMVAPLLK